VRPQLEPQNHCCTHDSNLSPLVQLLLLALVAQDALSKKQHDGLDNDFTT